VILHFEKRWRRSLSHSVEHVNVLLFKNFTTLDALGPAEVLSKAKCNYHLAYYSIDGGLIESSTGAIISTQKMDEILPNGILIVPGGQGTRELVNHDIFIEHLKLLSDDAKKVLSICTGSALLAKSGALNQIQATSNKRAWNWVISQSINVKWIRNARWVVDGKYYTSSGITAGIDMAIGYIEDCFGYEEARRISDILEYTWNRDKDIDPFS